MQIALCHENVLPKRGGAEMYVADLSRCLVAAGHEVHLYASRWDETALPRSMRYHEVPAKRGPRFLRPWRFSAALQKVLDRNPPEVSIGFDKVIGTDVYYPLGGLHVASADHNLLKHQAGVIRSTARMIQKLDLAQRSFAIFERKQLTGSRRPKLVVNSNFVRRHAHRYFGLAPDSIAVLRNAIDPNRFDETDRASIRAECRQKWDIPSDAVVAAIVAMNYRLKGLEPLLHAMTKTHDRVVLLVAGSHRFAAYDRMAEQLRVADRVRFIGHSGEIRRVFFTADVHVHPTFYDPCSLVVLEAMACGLPVITSSYNGAAELMQPPHNGFVIKDPHDADQLAGYINQFLDPDVRRDAGEAARQAAANWTFDHHVRAFVSILHQVVEKRLRNVG